MNRLAHIDWLRGLVMAIMVIDHARDYQGTAGAPGDPMNLDLVGPPLFLLRWITHFCAPVFAFLMGVSAWLGAQGRDAATQSRRMFQRGLLLLLLEFTLVDWGWTFNPFWHRKFFQVIAALGFALFALALFVRLERRWALAFGGGILLLHNLTDAWRFPSGTLPDYLWSILHQRNVLPLWGGFEFRTTYPVCSIVAVALLGYGLGKWVESGDRRLGQFGAALIGLFLLLRFGIGYGDPNPFHVEPTITRTMMAAFNVTKYPLSLQFVSITLGPALVLVHAIRNVAWSADGLLSTIGRNGLFFYVAHGYVLHLLALAAAIFMGFPLSAFDFKANYGGRPTGFGFPLWVTLPFAAVTIFVMDAVCRRWERRR